MRLRSMLSLALISLSAPSAFAQFGQYHYYSNDKYSRTIAKRAYFGVTFPMMSLDVTQHYKIDRSGPGSKEPSVDTTVYTTLTTPGAIGIKHALGIIGGASFKLIKTSESSAISLDVAATLDILTYKVGKIVFSTADSSDAPLGCVTTRVPIALMFKNGGEASLRKKDAFLFSIGAGLAPTIAYAGYGGNIDGYARMQPFLVSEIGAAFGIAPKFRVAYYPGSAVYMNNTAKGLPTIITDGDLTVRAIGSGQVQLSLVIIFGAHAWDEGFF